MPHISLSFIIYLFPLSFNLDLFKQISLLLWTIFPFYFFDKVAASLDYSVDPVTLSVAGEGHLHPRLVREPGHNGGLKPS